MQPSRTMMGWTAILLSLSGCDAEGPSLGAFSAQWSLTRGGTTIACSEAGVLALEVEATYSDRTTYTSRFPCELGAALTAYMPPGEYQVTERILDRSLSPIGDPTPVTNEELLRGRVVELVTVSFEMAPPY